MAEKIVLALGGNALQSGKGEATAKAQLEVVHKTCEYIAELNERGYEMAIVHGNGPQVGRILLASETKIVEIEAVKELWPKAIVITCGGGGIPVMEDPTGALHGTAAVIDKDFAAELLAEQVEADILVILTEVEKVAVNYNKPDQKNLDHLSLMEANRYCEEGQFAPGSMLPKVQAAMKFVRSNPSKRAIITSLDNAVEALDGKTGTIFTFN